MTVLPMHDQLREQRVVVGGNTIVGIDVRVDPHAWSAGQVERRDEPGRGSERDRILCVDANLDRMTARPHVRVEA